MEWHFKQDVELMFHRLISCFSHGTVLNAHTCTFHQYRILSCDPPTPATAHPLEITKVDCKHQWAGIYVID